MKTNYMGNFNRVSIFSISILVGCLLSSCEKTNLPEEEGPPSELIVLPTKTNVTGKWQLGEFKHVVYSVPFGIDTTYIYPNNNGNYVELKVNDTAYYTYTDGTTGYSPYKFLDTKHIYLVDTSKIIFFDNHTMKTYSKRTYSNTSFEEYWLTYSRF